MKLKGYYWGETQNKARKVTPKAASEGMCFIPGDYYMRKLPPADVHPRECIFEVPDWLFTKDDKFQQFNEA